ncbi:MAG: sugar transferase [Chloroflexota bacterium]|nr:sugar transferase [Chloroflexota bacterium]
MPKRRPQLQISERRALLAAGDLLAVCASVIIALMVWTIVDQRRTFTLEFVLSQSIWFIALGGMWLLLASANDFYELRIAAKRVRTVRRLLLITAQTWVVYIIVFFVSPPGALPRLFIVYYGIASLILIGVWRLSRPFLLGWTSEPRRALIIGTDWGASALITAAHNYAGDEYDLRGIIGDADKVGTLIEGVPVLGTGADLMNFVHRDQISELIVTTTDRLSGDLFTGVMDAYEQGITILPMPILYERITGRVPVEHVNDNWAVVFLPVSNRDGVINPYPFLKRLIDVGIALVGLLLFALMLPFLALLIQFDSRGGIFYTQNRMGRNGSIFRVYKLRSMVQDAEAESGAQFSHKGDPRVTRFGRIMRKTRLDELPQLLNVLRGEMSFVGPRPERPEHVTRLTEKIPFYRTRMIVRPGLTGWAQVQYNYGSTDEDAMIKLQYDLYYIRHQSLLLDLNIMIRTVGKVVSLSGV